MEAGASRGRDECVEPDDVTRAFEAIWADASAR